MMLFVGEACATSSGETGCTGDSSRSDAVSGGNVVDRSTGLSGCKWSGRKRSGSGSAVEPSAGSVTLEIGTATGVRVARGHCWQSDSALCSQGRRDRASLLP